MPLSGRHLISASATVLALCVVAADAVSTGNAEHSTPPTTSAVYAPAGNATTAQLSEVKADLVHRLSALGASGPTVVVHGDRIIVSARRVKHPRQDFRALATTDEVFFRPVLCYAPTYAKPPARTALPTSCTSRYRLAPSTPRTGSSVDYAVAPTPTLAPYPSTSPTQDAQDATVLLPGLPGNDNEPRYLLGPAELTGAIVQSAVVRKAATGWVVDATMTPSGSSAWNTMARQYFHEVIGIELDGVVQSAPVTLPDTATFRPYTGKVQISGAFTEQEATLFAEALNWGPLPVPLKEVSARPSVES
ncbi:MAG: SecDF P1 head subdomain-containing protein [Acidimicrobiales bacterium]